MLIGNGMTTNWLSCAFCGLGPEHEMVRPPPTARRGALDASPSSPWPYWVEDSCSSATWEGMSPRQGRTTPTRTRSSAWSGLMVAWKLTPGRSKIFRLTMLVAEPLIRFTESVGRAASHCCRTNRSDRAAPEKFGPTIRIGPVLSRRSGSESGVPGCRSASRSSSAARRAFLWIPRVGNSGTRYSSWSLRLSRSRLRLSACTWRNSMTPGRSSRSATRGRPDPGETLSRGPGSQKRSTT